MTKLNLETKGRNQELIREYLENNASDILVEKINNGVKMQKDGISLINKKTLDGFMKYAYDEAKKLVENGENYACVEDKVVYGWAIHYFEEDSIEGTLYNEDGSLYKSKIEHKAKKAEIKEVEKAKEVLTQLKEELKTAKPKEHKANNSKTKEVKQNNGPEQLSLFDMFGGEL